MGHFCVGLRGFGYCEDGVEEGVGDSGRVKVGVEWKECEARMNVFFFFRFERLTRF